MVLFINGEGNVLDWDESGDDMSRPPIQGIWLPKFYDQERERVFAHIHDGAGETSSIKQRLQKGTTDTGNVKFGIVEAEWDWLQKRFKGDAAREQKYFCALLALTQAMVYDDYWMYDNECWEEIGNLCKKMASKWREHLKMDDAALGLGLAGNPKHTPQMSKAALVRLLNWLKGQIEAHPDTDYKFSLATRKRRADAELHVTQRLEAGDEVISHPRRALLGNLRRFAVRRVVRLAHILAEVLPPCFRSKLTARSKLNAFTTYSELILSSLATYSELIQNFFFVISHVCLLSTNTNECEFCHKRARLERRKKR